ncbi:hypothetical protein JQV27_20040 [Sulfitobacter mediterraneus]|uniref:hypothetical protein n=1 Tax=Sulfitobacter mediterraneus TaxID=83219 RepID=UPI0019342472|nr:hypothetical protein [Sulfitobacter mediterraneus]MBM1635094.1 hypothetical protein [Sulfitobacter mediterraneus]MBM1642918.1 hypothetical protein [Sulfitobacter mediterraneus]MBM1646966.1 hypothetical protein [Sulfitobacter mediterraneus]MBM1651008.1 hypothetical protein [Sulfitobacter mediterraneus]MBM1655091.1 hypothetical protein [Sulfitobacter mediterraneus]
MTLIGTFLVSCGTIAAAGTLVLAEQAHRLADIDLSDSPLMRSATERKILEYTIECALPEGQIAFAEYEGISYQFSGVMRIAPEWADGPLSLAKQRDVTACLLARTNAFGVPVQISMRSETGHLAGLSMFQVSPEEQVDFPIWEGAFFGNIFASAPVAYACQGSPNQQDKLRAAQRICTLPSGELTPDGKPVSACGFVSLGPCGALQTSGILDTYADHMVHVYLGQPEEKK